MSNFLKKYIFNFTTLVFLFSFIGFYYFLQHRKLGEIPEEEKNKPYFVISDSILEINLVTDTAVSLKTFIINNTAKYRTLIILDGSCSVCLETLVSWKKIIDSTNVNPGKILILGYDASQVELEYALQAGGNSNIPLFNDH